MPLPQPPGLSKSAAQPPSQSPHPSLPPRPPTSASPIPSFKPRNVGAPQQQWPQSPGPTAAYQPNYGQSYYNQQPAQQYGGTAASYGSSGTQSTWVTAGADSDEQAQIAQWQSAYSSKDDGNTDSRSRPAPTTNTNGPIGLPSAEVAGVARPESGVASVISSADGSKKTVVRSGGGQTWQDPTLLEWDPSHFRLFVGNLAGETTDDSLYKAFAKYGSLAKARVIRDKRTTKSKGFGFVSFSDGDDYFKAAKDMNGKYIGSHPVILRKSNTEIKPVNPNQHKKKNNQNQNSNGNGNGKKRNDGPASSSFAGGRANTGAGVSKKSSKNKDGYKILG